MNNRLVDGTRHMGMGMGYMVLKVGRADHSSPNPPNNNQNLCLPTICSNSSRKPKWRSNRRSIRPVYNRV